MLRILVVDDEPTIRAFLRRVLEPAGYEVDEADDGVAAERTVRRSVPDLVVCDLYMPGRDGLEVIRRLRRQAPGVRVVAMSGAGDDGRMDLLTMARHLGAADALYKPLDRTTVLAVVGRLVGEPGGVGFADAAGQVG